MNHSFYQYLLRTYSMLGRHCSRPMLFVERYHVSNSTSKMLDIIEEILSTVRAGQTDLDKGNKAEL